VDLVITHPHLDHAGGWSTLARLRSFENVYLPAMQGSWQPLVPEEWVRDAQKLQRGDAWRSGDAELSVRWPPKPLAFEDANTISLVLRARWRDRELWLMGDVLALQERDLLDLGDPGCGPCHRLLKVGHHGSRSASDPAWIEALRPDVALVTAGKRNAFGFPHAATLEALRSVGCNQVWATGPHSGVRLEATPDERWGVETGEN
jgi:competence protein ComEC